MPEPARFTVRFDDLAPRARIREAAITLFGQHGPPGPSLRAIAKAANVSLGALLHHYPTRADLERTVHEEVLGEVMATLRTVGGEGDTIDTIRARRHAFAAMMRERPNVAQFLRRALLSPGRLGTELFEQAVAAERRELDAMVVAGLAHPPADPEVTAALYFVLVRARVLFGPQLEAVLGLDLDDPAADERLDRAEIELLTTPLFRSS